jgi:hypothetical protein
VPQIAPAVHVCVVEHHGAHPPALRRSNKNPAVLAVIYGDHRTSIHYVQVTALHRQAAAASLTLRTDTPGELYFCSCAVLTGA